MNLDACIRNHKNDIEMMKVLSRKLHIFLDGRSNDDCEVFQALLDWVRFANIQMTESYWSPQNISLVSV